MSPEAGARCRRSTPWGSADGNDRRNSSTAMTRRLITAVAVVMVFAAATAYAATTPIPPDQYPKGKKQDPCLPPQCFHRTWIRVTHVAVHNRPGRFRVTASGHLKTGDSPGERKCLRHRTLTLRWSQTRPRRVRDTDRTGRHSDWALKGRSKKEPRAAYVVVARRPIRFRGRRTVCGSEGKPIWFQPQ